ncbi:hypothetical protein NLJ89_g7451 [Agrocybe chaxingu]|uniref:Uncharacterized protein n=1 Tax=Agrocybe chaxingu TaxID=84603 RepID=A0A9W8JXC8_9AGAR|nr:hypothetical protein NLJ89_g7451 [Agrocybe chaxingu]
MSRPTNSPPVGPKFSIKVPPGWLVIATAISRKKYMQGVEVGFDIIQPESRIFGSKVGSANDLMRVTLDQSSSLPFKDQEDDYQLDITFYFSSGSIDDAEVLVDNNARSSKIHVVKTEKQPGSFVGPDSVTFIVFVEDTPTQEAGTGQFDDGVAMFHLVKNS